MEDRERYRPLLNIKKDVKDFFEDVEKEDKKSEIAIKKDFNALSSLIHKQRQDVEQAKVLLGQSKNDVGNLDRLHAKVRGIEQNMKAFKLKERQAYEQLVDEEVAMSAELDMWREKF